MSYEHGFTVLEASKYNPAKYQDWPIKDEIRIHADLIEYMWDSLNWLPTDFAHNKSIGQTNGLDRCGRCVLWSDGALMLGKICRGYASIFELGPDILELNYGSCYNTELEVNGLIPTSSIELSTTKFERKLIVKQLYDLAKMCDIVVTKNNTHYIAHCGL